MKLLLDLGNTRLKWAWLDESRLRASGHVVHGGQIQVQALARLTGTPFMPTEILLASVAAPATTAALREGLAARWAVPLRVARTEANGSGVVNGYAEPAQMGVDRWLAMVAAWARHGSAVCIADAGTALTVDLVGADGRHAGGLILPGLALMRRALLDDTGEIAASAAMGNAPGSAAGVLGRDTASCIREAARRASACVVESCVKALPGMAAPRLVVTGGDAAALIAALGGSRAEHRPCLVLEGLALRLCGVLPEPEILH